MPIGAKQKDEATFRCVNCEALVPELEIRPGLRARFCAQCKAIWFRAGDLADYLGTDSDLADKPPASPSEAAKRPPGSHRCPRCPQPAPVNGRPPALPRLLDRIPFAADTELWVERCPKCQGLWLEPGRLQAISRWVQEHRVRQRERELAVVASLAARGPGVHRRSQYASANEPAANPEPDEALRSEVAEVLARPRYGNLRPIEARDIPSSSSLPVDERWVNALSLPIALFVGWWVVRIARLMDFFLSAFTVPVHELGHAIAYWAGGYQATPLPFGITFISESRSLFASLCCFFLLGTLLRFSLRNHLRFPAAVAGALMVASVYLTWMVPDSRLRELGIADGVAGQFWLSALMMCAFYYRLPEVLRWDFWRFAVLLFAAYNFVSVETLWLDISHHSRSIPWGSLLGGEGDANGDMNRLVSDFGWSRESIVATYLDLGIFCLTVLASHYVVFLVRSLRREKTPSSSSAVE